MTLLGTKTIPDTKILDDVEPEEPENVWLDILHSSEVKHKLPDNKQVLVLGDPGCGKTALVAKIKKRDPPKVGGAGLEFEYVDVRDEYSDDHTKLKVHILDGDPFHKNLLNFVITPETVGDTIVVLMASMADPCRILTSLESWVKVLEEHIQQLPKEVLEKQKQEVLKRVQEYVEPGNEIDKELDQDGGSLASDAEIPHNLGIRIIVVISKCDYMDNLEKEHEYKYEHFDYMQLHIRQFCAKYGATLCYTSVPYDKNCDVLLKYVLHQCYNFPFNITALVVDRDAIFVPSGWDNLNKMNILVEALSTIRSDDIYDEVIVLPNQRKSTSREPEIVAEDDDAFLARLQGLLNQPSIASAGGRNEIQIRSPPAGVQKTADRRLSGSPGVSGSAKKIDAKPGSTSEGVLQNFFNSLLNRKTGAVVPGTSPVPVRGSVDKPNIRQEAIAELDRMSGRTKKLPPSHPHSPATDPKLNEENEEDNDENTSQC